MAQPEYEGGLVDVFREQRAQLLASLAVPAALEEWHDLSPDELAERFQTQAPPAFQTEVYNSIADPTGLRIFLEVREERIGHLQATEADDLTRIRASRAHQLALDGFTRAMTVNPQQFAVEPVVARNVEALGAENVVVDAGGLYIAGGVVREIDSSEVTIYLRRQASESAAD